MDFANAVAEHMAWKQRLKRILLGRERRRSPERTEAISGQDCPLGGWLRSQAAAFSNDPVFSTVEELHGLVHELAIEMVLSDDRAMVSLEALFQTGRFQICSQQLLEALEELRRKFELSADPLCRIPPGYVREGLPPAPGAPV